MSDNIIDTTVTSVCAPILPSQPFVEHPLPARTGPGELYLPYTPAPPPEPAHQSLAHIFFDTARRFPSSVCCATRSVDVAGRFGPYSTNTYEDVADGILALAGGLRERGIDCGSRVGIFSCTRWAWMLSCVASQAAGATVVPLYETLTDDDLVYVLNSSGVTVLFAAPQLAPRLASILKPGMAIKHIIFFDDTAIDHSWLAKLAPLGTLASMTSDRAPPCAPEDTPKADLRFYAVPTAPEVTPAQLSTMTGAGITYCTVRCAATAAPLPALAPRGLDDDAFVIYTSGSTGTPKGAVLSHRGIILDIYTSRTVMAVCAPADFAERGWFTFCYLPLAHVYELVNEWTAILCHGALYYFTGGLANFADDLRLARPTFLPTVPRVLERIHRNVQSVLSHAPAVVRLLYKIGFATQQRRTTNGLRRSALVDKVVFGKIRRQLGGRVQYITSGSAPLAPTVGQFVQVALGARVTEAYGATETSCIVTGQSFSISEFTNCIGTPLPGAQIKLVSRPDLGYTVDDEEPAGECYVRGGYVFKYYIDSPEATADALSADGWYRTGDIIRMVKPNGSLQVVDRAKLIAKLSQGEFYSATKVEAIITASSMVTQCFVYGLATEPFLVAAIQPDFEEIYARFPDAPRDRRLALARQDIQKAILIEVQAAAKQGKLRGFEIPRFFVLTSHVWTPESGELTPSMKVRRPAVKDAYIASFTSFYTYARALSEKRLEEAEAARVHAHIHDFEPAKGGLGVIVA